MCKGKSRIIPKGTRRAKLFACNLLHRLCFVRGFCGLVFLVGRAVCKLLTHYRTPFLRVLTKQSFDRRYNLKVHYRRHTNETPYPCKQPGCTQRFKWRSSLAHHMKTKHKLPAPAMPTSPITKPARDPLGGIIRAAQYAAVHSSEGSTSPESTKTISPKITKARAEEHVVSPRPGTYARDKQMVSEHSRGVETPRSLPNETLFHGTTSRNKGSPGS